MLKLPRGPVRKKETLTKIPIYSLGMGHATKLDINRYEPGQSLRTYDVNLDRAGSIGQRTGIKNFIENPIGAQQISTMEEAGWDASSASDAVIFRQYMASGVGAASRRITRGGAGSTDTILVFPAVLDLTDDPEEFIALWMYFDDVSLVTQVLVALSTGDATFTNQYKITLDPNALGYTNGWNLVIMKRSDWDGSIGAPDWSDVQAIDIRLTTSAATFACFDNMYLAPKQVDGLFNFRQSPTKGGGNFLIGAARGTIAYLSWEERRWIPLKTGLEPYVPVSFMTFLDWCYFANGYDPVGLIVGDGAGNIDAANTYESGIETPDASGVTLEAIPGGVLPTGSHYYRFEFFSEITGLPGNTWEPGDTANVPTITTAGGQNVQINNIPVSTDPKIAKVRIYRRDATSGRFRRVGEVNNGVTMFVDNVSALNLGNELAGYPAYVKNGRIPVVSMMAEVGSRVIAAGNREATGTVYVSALGNAEQWDLAKGPHRLDTGDNDPITSVFKAYGFACAGQIRGIHVGTPIAGPAGFSFVQRTDNSGPISHRGVIALEAGVWYRSHDGWYFFPRNWMAQKITRYWDTGPDAPGVIEPTFQMFDNMQPEMICGAYFKENGQLIWNDRLRRDPGFRIQPVLNVGHLEGQSTEDIGVGGWSFHRYAEGDDLGGSTCMASYVDSNNKIRVMSGGPGGFVYNVESGEFDDVLPTGRVAIKGNVLMPFMGPRGVALGQHQLKDYVYHDIVVVPIGNWNIDLEYYFDWRYEPYATAEDTGTGEFALGDMPFLAPGAFYAETGNYIRVRLPEGRHRNVAWAFKNERPGESFRISECTWYLEYLGAEGAT